MKTKTTLSLLAFVFTVSLPAAVAAELAGLSLPAALDSAHVFTAFIMALIGITAVADYRRPRFALGAPSHPARVAKADHALAA